MSLSSARDRNASRMSGLPTPKRIASSRSDGSLSPGAKAPERISSDMRPDHAVGAGCDHPGHLSVVDIAR